MKRLGTLIKRDMIGLLSLKEEVSISIQTLQNRDNTREKDTLDSLIEYDKLLHSFIESVESDMSAYGITACPEYLAILYHLIRLSIWNNSRQYPMLIKEVCSNRLSEVVTENRLTILQLLNDEMFNIILKLNTKLNEGEK